MNEITRTDIINKICDKYKIRTYLEIGVRVPSENFDKINVENKESVDPSPMGVCDYVMTSDEFFLNHVKNKKYDLIFVDGLHTNEQSYVDVLNSIKHLNDDGFIVMHDCNPIEKYHTRSYEDYLKTRGAWNGTVYKAFIRLKRELINWSCFVINEDWGCSVLTKRNLLKNIRSNININDLSWEEFDKNREELLQLITFEDFLNII